MPRYLQSVNMAVQEGPPVSTPKPRCYPVSATRIVTVTYPGLLAPGNQLIIARFLRAYKSTVTSSFAFACVRQVRTFPDDPLRRWKVVVRILCEGRVASAAHRRKAGLIAGHAAAAGGRMIRDNALRFSLLAAHPELSAFFSRPSFISQASRRAPRTSPDLCPEEIL